MNATPFDDLTDIYEKLIDWPKRLAHEKPFYRRIFDECGARRVLDVACGVGRHAAMFRSWGLSVEGADISAEMIARGANSFGESEDLKWAIRAFSEEAASDVAFDAAICAGNSLALAPDFETVRQAVAAMLSAVRPGGVIILHVLNLWRLADGPCLWQKCRRATLSQGEVLIVKGVHRNGTRGFVELLVLPTPSGEPLRCESAVFLGLEAEELTAMARDAGATEVQRFGGYQQQPYVRETSVDLVVTARR